MKRYSAILVAAALLMPVSRAALAYQSPPSATAPSAPAQAPAASAPQPANDDPTVKANQQKARALLDAMVDALGDLSWETLQDWEQEGRISYFEHGNPTGEITPFWAYHSGTDLDRLVFGKKKDVVQLFTATAGYEMTYKGRADLPKDQVEDFLRRRAHSVEVVARVWMKDPRTVLIYEGQSQVERRLADRVTLFSASNDSVTLEMDAETHLPLRRTFQWRNPIYKDKDEDVEEYDDYHDIQGFPTPYTITRYKNGDMVSQRFLFSGAYNTGLPPEMFDPNQFAQSRW
ncbi:MAG: hypothetical protein ACYCSN_01725 [Acidobacteriaceae bacterium]